MPLKPLVYKKTSVVRRSKEDAPTDAIWRPANGLFSENYEVADVISAEYRDRGIVRPKGSATLLLQTMHKRGYKYIYARNNNGKWQTIDVHQLTVVGDRPSEKHTVDHIICGVEYKTHNFSTDLRWATLSEQSCNQNRDKTKVGKKIAVTRTNMATGEITQHFGYADACADLKWGIQIRSAKARVAKAIKSGEAIEGHRFSMTLPEGTFKPVPADFIGGREGFKASQAGGIIVFPNRHFTTGYRAGGYLRIESGGTEYMVHRLVAAAWVEGYAPGLICNHIDHAEVCNNDASNLEWCTHAENSKAAVAAGKRYVRAVKQYSSDGVFIAEYSSIVEASRNVINAKMSNIHACCNERRQRAGGSMWEYA
jgi:hypothetical protein